MLLEVTPEVLSLGKLWRVRVIYTTGPAVRNQISSEMARELITISPIMYHFVVPGLSASSSSTTPSPTSPSSSSQDSVFDVNRYTENPVPERSGGTSEERSTETENKNKNGGREEVQSDLLHDLPDWLQDFRENLADESTSTEPWGNPVPKDRVTSSSSHELPMESRAKSGTGSGQAQYPYSLPEKPKL